MRYQNRCYNPQFRQLNIKMKYLLIIYISAIGVDGEWVNDSIVYPVKNLETCLIAQEDVTDVNSKQYYSTSVCLPNYE